MKPAPLLALCCLVGACSGGGGATLNGAGSAAQSGSQSANIDYAVWVLQLPTGNGSAPNVISASQLLSGYSSAYFHKATDGGQAFMDPQTGITSQGSRHCRTEMREATRSGAQASWSASGTNSMTISGKLLVVGGGSNGSVTLGQVFNATDAIPLCELRYSASAGGLELLYEESKGSGTTVNLRAPLALNAAYYFTLALTNGVLQVLLNGKQAYVRAPSPAALTKSFYFKFGAYDQTASPGPISTAPYTVLETYSAQLVHE